MNTRNTIPHRCNARASYLSMNGGAYCPKHCPPGADPWPALEPRKPCDYAMDDKGAARYVKAQPKSTPA